MIRHPQRYLLLALMLELGVQTPIALRVTPQSAFGPVTVRATITLEPNYLNTTLCLLWDSENGEAGSTCRTIEGQYAAKTNDYQVRLSQGSYHFRAQVYQGQTWINTPLVPVEILSQQ